MGPALALNLVSQEKILYFHFAVNFVAKLFVSLFVLPSLTMFNVYFQIWKSVILLRHSLEERKCITRYSHILGIRKKERKKEKGRKGGREEGRKEGRKERKGGGSVCSILKGNTVYLGWIRGFEPNRSGWEETWQSTAGCPKEFWHYFPDNRRSVMHFTPSSI